SNFCKSHTILRYKEKHRGNFFPRCFSLWMNLKRGEFLTVWHQHGTVPVVSLLGKRTFIQCNFIVETAHRVLIRLHNTVVLLLVDEAFVVVPLGIQNLCIHL